MYLAAKFAIEGLSESLSQAVQPFDIQIMILSPGFFRSNLAATCRRSAQGISAEYDASMSDLLHFLDAAAKDPSTFPGDPQKLGDHLVEAVDGTGFASMLDRQKLLRVILSADTFAVCEE